MFFKTFFSSSSIVKDSSWVALGNLLSGVLSVVVLPFLIGIYSKEVYGFYFSALSIVAIATIFVGYSAHYKIVVSDSDESAQVSLNVAITLCTVFSFALLLILFLFSFFFPDLYFTFFEWILIILSVYFNSIIVVFEYFLNYKACYSLLAKFRLAKSVLILAGAFAFSFFLKSLTGLLLAYVAALFLTIFMFLIFVRFNRIVSFSSLGVVLRILQGDPSFYAYNTMSTFLNSSSTNIFTLLLQFVFGPEINTYYNMAVKLFSTPILIVGQSIGTVLVKKFAMAKISGDSLLLIMKSELLPIIKLSFIPCLLIALFSPYLIPLLLGAGWEITGWLIMILSPWLYFSLISIPLSMLIPVMGFHRFGSFYNLVLLCVRTLILLLGLFYVPFFWVISLFSLAGVGLNVFFNFYILKKVRLYELEN